jgi:hypothetical protein
MNSYLKLPSWHKITNDLMAKYQGELDEPLTNLKLKLKDSDIDIDIFYKDFVKILLSTANEVFPKTRYNLHTKPYWNSEVKSTHTKERTMRKIWVQDGRPRGMQYKSYSEYKRAKRDFRHIQQHANEQYIQETNHDINNAAGCDLRLFWKMIKRQKLKN